MFVIFKELNFDGEENQFTKAVSSAKTVYNKSHGGFKKANAIAKKLDNSAVFLNQHANTVNTFASTHKDKRVRKANTYEQKGNNYVQKVNKGVQSGLNVANTAKSKFDKALDTDSNNAGVLA